MHIVALTLLVVLALGACKNGQKSQEDPIVREQIHNESIEDSRSEVPQAVKPDPASVPEDPEQVKALQPEYPDSLILRLQRTPCFGQCPVYTLNVYSSGLAVLEGKRFFDHIGTFKGQFTPADFSQIMDAASDAGFFQMNHVYDAPVTDLPSTTLIIRTESAEHWTYNRMNSPDELRALETTVEEMIKGKAWEEQKPKRQDRD